MGLPRVYTGVSDVKFVPLWASERIFGVGCLRQIKQLNPIAHGNDKTRGAWDRIDTDDLVTYVPDVCFIAPTASRRQGSHVEIGAFSE